MTHHRLPPKLLPVRVYGCALNSHFKKKEIDAPQRLPAWMILGQRLQGALGLMSTLQMQSECYGTRQPIEQETAASRRPVGGSLFVIGGLLPTKALQELMRHALSARIIGYLHMHGLQLSSSNSSNTCPQLSHKKNRVQVGTFQKPQ